MTITEAVEEALAAVMSPDYPTLDDVEKFIQALEASGYEVRLQK